MTLAAVPSDVFAELARTRPLPLATEALRAALHARRMLLVKSLLVRVERRRDQLTSSALRRFEKDWALLERAEESDAGAVRGVVDYPMTGAWLAETLAAPDAAAFQRHLAHLRGVAIVAAVRAGHEVSGTFTVRAGTLVLPGLGVLRCPSGRARLSGGGGGVEITDDSDRGGVVPPRSFARVGSGGQRPAAGGPGWLGLRRLPGSSVVVDDLDPYRVPSYGVGPDALPAGEHSPSAHRHWVRCWREAHRLLVATDPGRAVEVGALVRALVPLAPAGQAVAVPTSATSRAAPGAVLTQLPDDARELAECLVHETHHTKLAALHESVPLYHQGEGALHRVGWRTDLRPVPGVLQGAYAHLALTDLWWRARNGRATTWRRRAESRFDNYREQVGEALSILLESDELTIAGRQFVREMSRHHMSLGLLARHSR
ncbi:HEXXH motif domain-containing protein [Streptomyces sp. HUAS ZL42]|uniref:HEXXH motif domain-containing protein n=1 Tax=Streptomyces sp. HUAS ZL42 TaxID=3231715 RepID=UPI00345E3CDD